MIDLNQNMIPEAELPPLVVMEEKVGLIALLEENKKKVSFASFLFGLVWFCC